MKHDEFQSILQNKKYLNNIRLTFIKMNIRIFTFGLFLIILVNQDGVSLVYKYLE